MSWSSVRSAELLAELQKVLLLVYDFDDLEINNWARTTISLMQASNNGQEDLIDLNKEDSDRIIDSLFASYREQYSANPSSACGAFLVAACIESKQLSGNDAKLVHGLARLHISRASAMLRSRRLSPQPDPGAGPKGVGNSFPDLQQKRRPAGFLPLWSVRVDVD